MSRWTKWVAPVASLAMVLSLAAVQSRADDAPKTGKATVTVTVVDDAGKPVAGAMVAIQLPMAGKKAKGGDPSTQPAGDAGGKAARPQPIESGVTGADGSFALTKMADGDFVVTARMKGAGNGRSKVSIMDGKDTTVSVTLKPGKGKN